LGSFTRDQNKEKMSHQGFNKRKQQQLQQQQHHHNHNNQKRRSPADDYIIDFGESGGGDLSGRDIAVFGASLLVAVGSGLYISKHLSGAAAAAAAARGSHPSEYYVHHSTHADAANAAAKAAAASGAATIPASASAAAGAEDIVRLPEPAGADAVEEEVDSGISRRSSYEQPEFMDSHAGVRVENDVKREQLSIFHRVLEEMKADPKINSSVKTKIDGEMNTFELPDGILEIFQIGDNIEGKIKDWALKEFLDLEI
jgi:hypothetical protein